MAEIELNLLAASPPSIPIIEYQEWIRLVNTSTKKSVTGGKFLLNLILYLIRDLSLIFTVIRDFTLDDERKNSIASLSLYVVLNIAAAALYAGNQPSCLKTLTYFLLNICFSAIKPFRYCKSFVFRNKREKVMNAERHGEFLSKKQIQTLAKLLEQELQEIHTDLLEICIHMIPMMFLQTYYLFEAHQGFQICNFHDLTRLGTILTPVVQLARAAQEREATILNYKQTLHFLEFYRTNGNNQMVIYSKDSFTISGMTSFCVNFSSALVTFYTATYFMVISPVICLVYLAFRFFVNLIVLWMFPDLLNTFQNPPYGVSTRTSFWTDRFLNIFVNVGTKFNGTYRASFTLRQLINQEVARFITSRSELVRKLLDIKVKLPLVLLHLILYGVPLWVVYLTSYCFDTGTTTNETQIAENITKLNETLEACAELNSTLHSHPAITVLGHLLFSWYRGVDDRFQAFNDIFHLFHMLWLLVYCKLLCTWVYALANRIIRTKNNGEIVKEIFPVITGHAFFDTLLKQALGRSEEKRLETIRKLIVLTTLKKDEFYDALKTTGFTNERLEELMNLIADRLPVTDVQDAEEKIRRAFEEGHPFEERFREIHQLILNSGQKEDPIISRDKRLFCGFFCFFDRKISEMSSDRIEKIFDIMGIKINKWDDGPWERQVIGFWEI